MIDLLNQGRKSILSDASLNEKTTRDSLKRLEELERHLTHLRANYQNYNANRNAVNAELLAVAANNVIGILD